ncbi:MAG: hypothetical protein GIW98_06460 [Candidatus Eremiobacteraeota bacterium]|nr:hypothetical protein [Candidatus Eremiobacteraeota bacterium]
MKIIIAALALASTLTPSAARSADNGVLRHLVYNVRVGLHQEMEVKRSGLESRRIGVLSPTARYSTDTRATGTIAVDVIAQTPTDLGLVVMVSERTDRRDAARAEVGIEANGTLHINPSDNVTEEEKTLLRFLARGLVSASDVNKGSRWTINAGAGETTDRTDYEILLADGSGVVRLKVDRLVKVPGAQAYSAITHGKATYDTRYIVPTDVSFSTRTEEGSAIDQYTTTFFDIDLELQNDSMRKAKA